MLLFSTVLDIKDSITPDDFIQLVIKWNNTSTHTENIVTGIEWQGERTARYGDDRSKPAPISSGNTCVKICDPLSHKHFNYRSPQKR